jgi:hypothetical protein
LSNPHTFTIVHFKSRKIEGQNQNELSIFHITSLWPCCHCESAMSRKRVKPSLPTCWTVTVVEVPIKTDAVRTCNLSSFCTVAKSLQWPIRGMEGRTVMFCLKWYGIVTLKLGTCSEDNAIKTSDSWLDILDGSLNLWKMFWNIQKMF